MLMKTLKTILAIAFVVSTSVVFNACNKANKLSTTEKENLKYLREEEKLARDVYLHAYDKYGEEVFKNISNSEQKHMDKVLGLLEDYKIDDPASSTVGVFSNSELQNLYNILAAQVDSSLKEALIVGATIEDVDIFDIDEFLANTKQKDIIKTYENLNCGSDNHMRAFTSKLSSGYNYTYTPQYITIDEYAAILAAQSGGCGKK